MRMMEKAARMRRRRSPRRRRSKQRSDGQAKRDLKRVSESYMAEALGDLDASEVRETSQSSFRIMCYEYLAEESNSKQRQSKNASPEKIPFVQLPQSKSAETSHPLDLTELTIGSPNPTQSPRPLPPFTHNPNPPRQLPRAHVIAMIKNLSHDQPLHRREPREDRRHPIEEDPVAVMHVRPDGPGQRSIEHRRRHLDLHRGEPGSVFQRVQGRGVFGVPGWVHGFGDHVACVGDS